MKPQSSFQKALVMSPGPPRSAVEAVVFELYFGLKIHFSGYTVLPSFTESD